MKNSRNTKFDKRLGEAKRSSRPVEKREIPREVDENVISGRNAVKELLSSGRDIEKIYIQSGEREGSVNLLIGLASERKINIIETEIRS